MFLIGVLIACHLCNILQAEEVIADLQKEIEKLCKLQILLALKFCR